MKFKNWYFFLDYDDTEYSDVENIIEDAQVEEKLGKLLRSMQPEMPKGKKDIPYYNTKISYQLYEYMNQIIFSCILL